MPSLPPRLPLKLVPRGDFNPEEFRNLFAQRGKQVLWEMAAVCPCGTPLAKFEEPFNYTTPLADTAVSQEARVDCPICSSKGWYAHSSQTITVLLHAMALNPRRYGVTGDYAVGRARVSTLPENKLAIGDRLTVTESVQRVVELLRRKAGATTTLRFPIASETLDLSTGPVVTRVLQAIRALPAGTVASGQVMVEGVDFTVDSQGRLVWGATANKPAVGDAFSITYYAKPRYVVEDLPAATRDDRVHYKTAAAKAVQLPQSATVRQEYRGDAVNPEVG